MTEEDDEDGPAPIAPVGTERATRFLIPAAVTGDSEGDASARVGFGLLRGFGEATDATAWDLAAVIGVEVTTQQGLARLVGLQGEGEVEDEPAGSLRASLSLARLDFEGEGGSAYPPLTLYLGGKVGRAPFSYLGPGPARRTQGTTPALELTSDVEVPWGLGAGVLYIPAGRPVLVPTVEAQTTFESRWTASPRTAEWCLPVGDVARGGDPSSPTTSFDTAQSCSKATLGAPSNTQELSIVMQVGLLDRAAGSTWRGAVGLDATVPVAVDKRAAEELRLSLRAPFFVTLARAPEGVEYRGVIRLTPSLEIRRLETGTTDVGAMLELALIGQRGLFPDELDAL